MQVHHYIRNGDIETETILEEMAATNPNSLNERDKTGYTPLHTAVQEYDIHIVKKLLQLGADYNLTTQKEGWTAASMAAAMGYLVILKELYRFSTRPNRPPLDDQGDIDRDWSPLHRACYNSQRRCVQYIVRTMKWDVNKPNCYGQTPLDLVIERRVDVVLTVWLAYEGAITMNLDIAQLGNQTPYDSVLIRDGQPTDTILWNINPERNFDATIKGERDNITFIFNDNGRVRRLYAHTDALKKVDYFRELFRSVEENYGSGAIEGQEVEISVLSYESMLEILHWAYSGDFKTHDFNLILQIWKDAEAIGIQSVSHYCKKKLSRLLKEQKGNQFGNFTEYVLRLFLAWKSYSQTHKEDNAPFKAILASSLVLNLHEVLAMYTGNPLELVKEIYEAIDSIFINEINAGYDLADSVFGFSIEDTKKPTQPTRRKSDLISFFEKKINEDGIQKNIRPKRRKIGKITDNRDLSFLNSQKTNFTNQRNALLVEQRKNASRLNAYKVLSRKNVQERKEEHTTQPSTKSQVEDLDIGDFVEINPKPKIIQVSERCAQCKQIVYATEKILASGQAYHQSCFTCSVCSRVLDPANCSKNEGKYFCFLHFNKLFGNKANKENQGGSVNSIKAMLDQQNFNPCKLPGAGLMHPRQRVDENLIKPTLPKLMPIEGEEEVQNNGRPLTYPTRSRPQQKRKRLPSRKGRCRQYEIAKAIDEVEEYDNALMGSIMILDVEEKRLGLSSKSKDNDEVFINEEDFEETEKKGKEKNKQDLEDEPKEIDRRFQATDQSSQNDEHWGCSECTFQNKSTSLSCEICDSARTDNKLWSCSVCYYSHNNSDVCDNCTAPRTIHSLGDVLSEPEKTTPVPAQFEKDDFLPEDRKKQEKEEENKKWELEFERLESVVEFMANNKPLVIDLLKQNHSLSLTFAQLLTKTSLSGGDDSSF